MSLVLLGMRASHKLMSAGQLVEFHVVFATLYNRLQPMTPLNTELKVVRMTVSDYSLHHSLGEPLQVSQ